MADQTRNEPPRLHITHHQASRMEHTGVGEYQVIEDMMTEARQIIEVELARTRSRGSWGQTRMALP